MSKKLKATTPAHQVPPLSKTHKKMHAFIGELARYYEDPSMWPLTHAEQTHFTRYALACARRIRNSEEYLAEGVRITAEDLAMAS